jgi:hypothetical protein
VTRRRHRTIADPINLGSSLGRYGFTALAALALLNNLLLPGLVCTAIAAYAWRNR